MIGSANLLEIFPFMKFLPLDIHKRIKYYIELSEKLFSSKFQERKQTYKDGTIRNITDALIKALKDAENEDSKAKGVLTEQCLKNSLTDLVIAGADSTSEFFDLVTSLPSIVPRSPSKDTSAA